MLDQTIPFDNFNVRNNGDGTLSADHIHVSALDVRNVPELALDGDVVLKPDGEHGVGVWTRSAHFGEYRNGVIHATGALKAIDKRHIG